MFNKNKTIRRKMKTWKEFKQRYDEDTTASIQLMQMAKLLKIPNFHYDMRDEMHLLPKDKRSLQEQIKPLNVMTNIHTSKENGVHHSCFYCSNSENYFFYSYGLPHTKEVENFLGEGISSTLKIQEEGSKYCGQMSLYVLYCMSRMTKSAPADATDDAGKFTDVVLSFKNECENFS